MTWVGLCPNRVTGSLPAGLQINLHTWKHDCVDEGLEICVLNTGTHCGIE